jgi:hypothetical protein
MVVCNYGSAPRPRIPFPYSTEAWTGMEYLVGSLFFEYGMLREGVETYAGTRRRHDGERRNPFNEPECGHHYARAMSSWSGMAVLSAFRYDGPEHRLRFERKAEMPPFRSFWATGTGWGRYTLTLEGGRTKAVVEVLCGSLPVREFTVEASGNAATLRSGNHKLDCQIEVLGKLRRVSVPEVIGIHEGEILELIV